MIRGMKFSLPAIALLGLLFLGAAKKPTVAALQVFNETDATDGPSFSEEVMLTSPPKKAYISRMPLLTQHDIVEFYPFDARDGSGTTGAYFSLGPHGAKTLEQFTMGNRGKHLIVVVNGRRVTDLLINGPVGDGILVIPHGLLPSDILTFGSNYDIIGQPRNDSRKRSEAIKKMLAGDTEPTVKSDDAPKPSILPKSSPTPKPVPTPKPQKES